MDPLVQTITNVTPSCVIDKTATWQVRPVFNDSQANDPSGPFDLVTARAAAVALLSRTNCLSVQIEEVA